VPAASEALAYQQLLSDSRRTVFWALDDQQPWQLEAGGAPVADGGDWFFLVNFPRTGSTAAAEILDLHPEICCGNEQQVLPLLMTILHSRLLLAPELAGSVRYTKQLPVTAATVRALMDAWRSCVSGKRLFGDKGEMYHQRFGEPCAAIFPGCRFVLTVRHPLDALSSYVRQPWALYLRFDGHEAFQQALRRRAREMLTANAAWRERAAVIEFEALATEAGFRATFARVLAHLGADPAAFDWDAGWARCRHAGAIGRGRGDEELEEFMRWLEPRDGELHEALARGAYYLEAAA